MKKTYEALCENVPSFSFAVRMYRRVYIRYLNTHLDTDYRKLEIAENRINEIMTENKLTLNQQSKVWEKICVIG